MPGTELPTRLLLAAKKRVFELGIYEGKLGQIWIHLERLALKMYPPCPAMPSLSPTPLRLEYFDTGNK